MNNSLYEAPQSDVQMSEPTGSRFWIVARWIALLQYIVLWLLAMAFSMLSYLSTQFSASNSDIPFMVFWGAVSAIVVVLPAYMVAPKAKFIVASMTYGVGFLISLQLTYFAISISSFGFESILISISAGAAFVGGGLLLLALRAISRAKLKSDTPLRLNPDVPPVQ